MLAKHIGRSVKDRFRYTVQSPISDFPVPTIRFYELASERFQTDPLLLVAKLAEKAFESQQGCLILAIDDAQAQALDDRLWSYSDDAFLPHQIAGQDDDDECPVLIVTPDHDFPAREVTINLRNVPVPAYGDRLLEIIPIDADGKARARERFKAMIAHGLAPTHEKV
jgi:DNA polymerase III subunit chi